MIFNRDLYDKLHSLVFRGDYPGYKPNVVELPNGDGRSDTQKRYAHISTKNGLDGLLGLAFEAAFREAFDEAERRNVRSGYWPAREACALRVLEYPAGSGGEKHTDFDLFTINLWRDPADGVQTDGPSSRTHIGEIGELVGMGPATPHWIPAQPMVQRSLIFFALPLHDAILPSGQSVGSWVAERIARSRTYR